ncbi:glycosyltransferase [Clostridium sp. BJN0013]|uniref:glycosyltransferase n=1 Tax=Clostridium sp. BJN0013 TaxID=3236840 RepID=UPI0034C5B8F1
MNIAMILTNGFDPDPRVYKEAKSLKKLGHKITILCWDREGTYVDTPEEDLDGIHIVRFFGNAEYGTGYKQIFKFLNFKDDVYNYMKDKNFQALHCHDFDGLFIGYSINKKLKLKVTYDEHDLFYMYFYNRKGLLNKLIYYSVILLEKHMVKRVDTHIVVTPKMKEVYKKISKNIYIVNNAPYKSLFNDIEKTPDNLLRIGFIGSVRYYDEIKALIDAAQKYDKSVKVIICGWGIYAEQLASYSKKFSNVEIKGAYNISELEQLYKNIDVTYAFYPGDTATISMPNKFYESIITETPIIANKVTEFGHEVWKNNFGYGIEGKNLKEEIEHIIEKLLKDPAEKNNIIENMRKAKNNYFWESNESKLNAIYTICNS